MILGIDPGRSKIGWALATLKGNLILSGTCLAADMDVFLSVVKCPVDQWEKGLARWVCEGFFSAFEPELEYVALGDGTGSREIAVRCAQFGLKTVRVDEKGTTMAARDLYWRFHRPAWWQRCLPRSLWVPPRDVDDFAAWAILLRSVAKSAENG
ncbi:MAG: endonuclease [Synergistaceae bacterium]|jgi:RNase H-fold protein (predicted Holliday junction resolvase)|nr:endonuclease [Synergistaceae bacterium]